MSGCSEPKKRRVHDDDDREAAYPKPSASVVLAEVARVEASGEAPAIAMPSPAQALPPPPSTGTAFALPPEPPRPVTPPTPPRYAVRGPSAPSTLSGPMAILESGPSTIPSAGPGGAIGILTSPGAMSAGGTDPTAPTVKLRGLRATEGVDAAPDERVVRRMLGAFARCYARATAVSPLHEAKVHVEVPVDVSGAVGVIDTRTVPESASLRDCIQKRILIASFASPAAKAHRVIFDLDFADGEVEVGGVVGGVPGGVVGGVAGGVVAAAPTIEGTLLEKATALDVEKALRAAGCTSVSSELRAGSIEVVVFRVTTKEGVEMTITFVPAKAPPGALPPDEQQRLERDAVTRKADGFFLAIESTDKTAARALLRVVVKD